MDRHVGAMLDPRIDPFGVAREGHSGSRNTIRKNSQFVPQRRMFLVNSRQFGEQWFEAHSSQIS
jgi:hypothetical protein